MHDTTSPVVSRPTASDPVPTVRAAREYRSAGGERTFANITPIRNGFIIALSTPLMNFATSSIGRIYNQELLGIRDNKNSRTKRVEYFGCSVHKMLARCCSAVNNNSVTCLINPTVALSLDPFCFRIMRSRLRSYFRWKSSSWLACVCECFGTLLQPGLVLRAH
jgi:hypothetical protein